MLFGPLISRDATPPGKGIWEGTRPTITEEGEGMDRDVGKKIEEYLQTHGYMRLATVDPEGKPLVRTVGYVADGPVVFFTTDQRTRKIRDIKGNSRVAYTVDEDYGDWSVIQGVMMEGVAALVTEKDEIERVMGLFMERYPQMTQLPPGFEMALVRVDPVEGYFLDNTVTFGHMDKVTF
jgi:general stress protein 26